jgi:hypothetical protein
MEVGYHENGQIAADQLREVARLLARVQADYYLDEVSGPPKHASWPRSIPHNPGYKELHCEHFKPDLSPGTAIRRNGTCIPISAYVSLDTLSGAAPRLGNATPESL